MDDAALDHDASDHAAPEHAARPSSGLLTIYAVTLCLSALLLFSVQPMFARLVLPRLGGSPSVWAVAMCFFQAALLAGYGYAHVVGRIASQKAVVLIHLALLTAALLTLPFHIPASWGDPPPGDAYRWQLGVMALGVGLPFLAVAATAPLLQAWFARTGHPHASDPYFLYGASNIGSLGALLLYPVVIEPKLGLAAQGRWWTIGYLLLIGMIWACARQMLDSEESRTTVHGQAIGHRTSSAPDARFAPVTIARRARWVFLAFVPSAMIIAVTNHVTTDVASAPFLWVIPLALFLATFILVFRERSFPPHGLMLFLQPFAIAAMLGVLRTGWDNAMLIGSGVALVGFFVVALVCHRELYLARPEASRLTAFYLWMSFGGVLGGIFSALIAPQIFSTVAEFPLLLLLSLACRPGLVERLRSDKSWIEPGAAVIVGCGALALAAWLLTRYTWPWQVTAGSVALGLIGAGIALSRWRPRLETALIALMALSYFVLPPIILEGVHQRSFFGVYRTVETGDGEHRLLQHGTTVHGAERIKDENGGVSEAGHPISYYYPESPMARGVGAARAAKGEGAHIRAGLIGLGTGSMTCHAEEGDHWRVFEIDPLIVEIAKDTQRFRILTTCQPNADIVLGDARLTMAREAAASFDYIVVDAFSSDAIPIHLLTLEAVRMYLSKLTDKGVLALHVSNRHLDLVHVAASLLGQLPGVHAVFVDDQDADGSYDQMKSDVVFLSKDAASLEPMLTWNQSRRLEPAADRAWTDDYSGIFQAFWRRYHPPPKPAPAQNSTRSE